MGRRREEERKVESRRNGVSFVFWCCCLVVVVVDAEPVVPDPRVVPYDVTVSMNASVFSDPDVSHFSEMLFNAEKSQLVVGARDALYRLHLHSLNQLEKSVWEADGKSVELCKVKGQPEPDCRNFVKVLARRSGGGLLVCATHAFDPKCWLRQEDRISAVMDRVDGRGRCPYSPDANFTTLTTTPEGDHYVAGPIGFSNNDPVIFRTSSPSLRTNQYDQLWLNRPQFVTSFDTPTFVYFVFRETAMETSGCGVRVRSRIARVCKNDEGGRRSKENWSTFLKVRLNCSLPNHDDPFYFDRVQDARFVRGILYATFATSSDGVVAGSAVCAYRLSAIERTFDGNDFLAAANVDSVWKPHRGNRTAFQCSKNDADDNPDSSRFQLVEGAVNSITGRPLHHEIGARYEKLAVDPLDADALHVMFVAVRVRGGDGGVLMKKLSFDATAGRTCLVEVVHPFRPSDEPTVHKMAFVAGSVYLATETGVMRIPTQRCGRFVSEDRCVNAMDPYCRWNGKECMAADRGPSRQLSCPVVSSSSDGGWGSWSEWKACAFRRPDDGDVNDACRCRRRPCNNGSCRRGSDDDDAVEVTNCTVRGGWTSWSDWSACSNSCDVGRRQRKRRCGNPEPAFGGRTCVGRDVDTRFCSDLPPCPPPSSSVWSEWSRCSTQCGRGFRSRNDAAGSQSCPILYEVCDGHNCIDVTDWTPWLNVNSSHQQRFRFHGPQSSVESEHRHTSSSPPLLEWSEWSSCSRECGGGVQLKVVAGNDDVVVERGCNDVPCSEEEPCGGSGSQTTTGSLVGTFAFGLLVGTVLGALVVYYVLRFHSNGYRRGSPHYLSAKSNNLYVTLPMLDLKRTTNQTDFDTLRSTTSCRSKVTEQGGDYETATIKRSRSCGNRNSCLLSGGGGAAALRADLDSDNIFR